MVEDDQLSSDMLLMKLKGLFKRILVAADGSEGLRLFWEHHPDIVLTDQIMPGLSGLDLVLKIRATGAKTPVVLMTSSIDNAVLLQSINAGVERFIPKPFDLKLLVRTLSSISKEIVNDQLREQLHNQEFELLRCRDAYNSMQQESARRKERHVVRHDLRNRIFAGANGAGWGLHVVYSPRDIMCGDGYSVRNLFDGRQLIFVVDAMGSGMSASLTAMLATSFFNYQVDNLYLWGSFTLRLFLKRFQEYLCSMLLEEEVLSCGFFLVDLVKEEIETALFALPPVLLRGMDGSVQKIRGENPPLGVYLTEVKTGSLSLVNAADLLIMTDGVTDAMLNEGGSYREELERDFLAAPTLKSLQKRFKVKTDQETSDDLTLLHLRRLDVAAGWRWSEKVDLNLASLSGAICTFLDALHAETDLHPVERDELEVVLSEALINSFEHGCLCMDGDEKTRLQLAGDYEHALESRVPLPDAGIAITASLSRAAGKPLLLVAVQDNGSGLSDDALRSESDETRLNGRGLRMIAHYSDSFFFGGPGGRLIILKTLEGEEAYAN